MLRWPQQRLADVPHRGDLRRGELVEQVGADALHVHRRGGLEGGEALVGEDGELPAAVLGQTCRRTQPRSSSRETAWESRLREDRHRSASSLIRIARPWVSESATRIS